MAVIDISEPDYCEYLFKVSTRFMCAAGTQFRRASTKLHEGTLTAADVIAAERSAVELDAQDRTIHKHLDCRISSDF